VNGVTLVFVGSCLLRLWNIRGHAMDYRGFTIELFEAGTGLWHARIQLVDQKPIIIDGVLFSALEVGFAWSTREAAAADARSHIDLFNQRCPNFGRPPQAERSAAI
jgi:hypothetical protein